MEFKIFFQYGSLACAACRHEFAFVASAREPLDAVELPCNGEGEGESADRPSSCRLGAREIKLQFDKRHKKQKKDPRTLKGEISLVFHGLTLACKAVRGELRGIKRDMFSMNYQNSMT
jgi:hypothetical protein